MCYAANLLDSFSNEIWAQFIANKPRLLCISLHTYLLKKLCYYNIRMVEGGHRRLSADLDYLCCRTLFRCWGMFAQYRVGHL